MIGATLRSRGRIALSAVTLMMISTFVAACGGSSSAGVAHLSSGKTASTGAQGGGSSSEGGLPSQQQMVAFAQCMRSHGVPSFPEPVEGRIELHGSPGSSGAPGSPQFEAAQKQCSKLLPNGGRPSPQVRKQAEERALKFSACMRSHGVPNFPEPKFGGGGVKLALKAGGANGIDPRSPQFQAAAKACEQYFGPPGSKPHLGGGGGGLGVPVLKP
jgi:hypothetical protein